MIYSPNSESRIRAHIAHLERKQKIEHGKRTKEFHDQLGRDNHYAGEKRPSRVRWLWRRLLGR